MPDNNLLIDLFITTHLDGIDTLQLPDNKTVVGRPQHHPVQACLNRA